MKPLDVNSQIPQAYLSSKTVTMTAAAALCRGRLREAEARPFFQQITLALDYCHKMGIANRSLRRQPWLQWRWPLSLYCNAY